MLTLVLTLQLFVTNQAGQPAEPAPIDIVSRARAILSAFDARQFSVAQPLATDDMKAALSAGRVEAMWTRMLAQGGTLKGCAPDSRIVTIDDKRMVITACEFERMIIDIQLAFDTAGRLAGMTFRPKVAPAAPYSAPPYADPAKYNEQNVTIGTPEWPLPATLTIPAGDKAYPAVVLVHGSGPHDRDESVGPNKPFKDLALGLASQGIAVLRYDKRSKVHARRMAATPSPTVKEEVVDDAVEALAWVGTHPSIDPARIFVLGHSLGGTLIPRIVAASKTAVAGAIVLAGATGSIDAAIVEQTRYLAMLDGSISAAEQQQIDAAEKASASIRALAERDTAANVVISGAPASYWRDLQGYDPASAAANLNTRLFILQGERDYQVPPPHFERWKRALGAKRTVTFRSYPALNHLFMSGSGAANPEEYLIPSHVASEVVRDLAEWMSAIRPR